MLDSDHSPKSKSGKTPKQAIKVMTLSSKLNYSPDVMRKVALSIAVMVVRFAPKDFRFVLGV